MPKSASLAILGYSKSLDGRYNISVMCAARYCVLIEGGRCIGIDMPYDMLVVRVMEFTMRGAIAKSADESDWEHEQLRKHGIDALQIFHDGKAIWDSAPVFSDELAEARREGVAEPFQAQNELDPEFYKRLDRDLRAGWGRLGYHAESLRSDMKALFSELEHEAAQRAAEARERLLADFLYTLQELP